MKIIHSRFANTCISLCLFIFACTVVACTQVEEPTSNAEYAKLLQQSNSTSVTTHRWFYFTSDGFKETDIPRNAPKTDTVPWTQAIRITSSAFINGKSYLAVNKLGIIESPQTFGVQTDGIASKTKLIKNNDLFSNESLANMYYIDEQLLFNFYTNSIFEQSDSEEKNLNANNPFLVEFNTSTYSFTPLLSKQSLVDNLIFEPSNETIPNLLETEIREVFYTNDEWHILFKANQSQRTDFYALSFTANEQMSSTQDTELRGSIKTVNNYREIVRPKLSSALPLIIQNLLKPVPNRVSYYLNYSEENSPATMQYEHLPNDSRPIQGYALGFEHCSIAVFEDGTICFAGGLPSKGVLNNGETKAFKLPDLGAGYVYGSIALSGSTLLVSWEETSFYETGSSGFLAVDMEQVLYDNSDKGE